MVCPVAKAGHCEECGPPETEAEMAARHAREREWFRKSAVPFHCHGWTIPAGRSCPDCGRTA